MYGSNKSRASRTSGVSMLLFLHSNTADSRMARASRTVIRIIEAENQSLPDSLDPWHCVQSSSARSTTFIGARLYRSDTRHYSPGRSYGLPQLLLAGRPDGTGIPFVVLFMRAG